MAGGTLHATHVLVVDDDYAIREALRLALEDEGYVVHEAKDGLEALQVMEDSRYPQVVLLDYRMPRLDGAGVLTRALRREGMLNRNAFILISANLAILPESFISILARLDVTVIAKPFDMDDLFDAITRAARTLMPGNSHNSAAFFDIPD